MNRHYEVLEKIHFKIEFTREEKLFLCSDPLRLKSVDVGEFLIREGDTDRGLLLLLQGQFNVFKQVQPHMILGTLHAGSFCGEIAWFTGQPRTASVVAIEPSLALQISYEHISFYDPYLIIKIYYNVLFDLIKRREQLNQILFKLADLERSKFGGSALISPVGHLRGIPFFANFTEDEVQTIRMQSDYETIGADGYIYKEGEHSNSFFILLKGSVMVTQNRNPELALVTLGSERFFGVTSLFGEGTQSCNLIALDSCEGLRIPLDAFNELSIELKIKLCWQIVINVINRLVPLNIAKIKLEHMEGKMWFGG